MPKRHRPHISVTPSEETLAMFYQVGRERGLDGRGVIMDFIVHDYLRLRSLEATLQIVPAESATAESVQADLERQLANADRLLFRFGYIRKNLLSSDRESSLSDQCPEEQTR